MSPHSLQVELPVLLIQGKSRLGVMTFQNKNTLRISWLTIFQNLLSHRVYFGSHEEYYVSRWALALNWQYHAAGRVPAVALYAETGHLAQV